MKGLFLSVLLVSGSLAVVIPPEFRLGFKRSAPSENTHHSISHVGGTVAALPTADFQSQLKSETGGGGESPSGSSSVPDPEVNEDLAIAECLVDGKHGGKRCGF